MGVEKTNDRKIVFFVTGLNSGGIENYLLRFLQEKYHNFEDIVVWCKSGKGGQLESEYLKLDNVKIYKYKIGFYDPKALFYLKHYLVKNNVKVVCDFTGNFAGVILYCARKAGIKKRVVFYRGSNNHFKESRLRLMYNKLVKKLVYENATSILSNSKAAFNFFYPNKWRDDSRFKVIYNGVNADKFLSITGDLRQELGIPDNAFVIGHTGRYNSAKNHETILKVAKALVHTHPDIYFILCGNGVKKNLNEYVVEETIDKNRILFFENRNDIPLFLNSMDCYYFPSVTEGQPNALIEAMIKGIPFVASDIEPIKETVPAEYHKQLIGAVDNKTAIDRILQIKNDVERKTRFKNLQKYCLFKFCSGKPFDKFYNELI